MSRSNTANLRVPYFASSDTKFMPSSKLPKKKSFLYCEKTRRGGIFCPKTLSIICHISVIVIKKGHNLKAGCVSEGRLRDGTHHHFESSRKGGFLRCQA